MALVDRQFGRAGQGDAAVGAGDVAVLVQSAQVASHRGERDAESFGDLLHAQRTGFDGLQEPQNLLAPARAADVPAARDQSSSAASSAAEGPGVQLVRLIVFAHGYRSYMRDVRKSTLDARINHLRASGAHVDGRVRIQACCQITS